MESNLSIERTARGIEIDDASTFTVVIVYDDAPAGHRAMRTATILADKLRDQVEVKPQLWRLDALEDSEWFALALADAINADMLILSIGRASGLSPTVERWLKLCLTRKRGTSAAVVALLGPNDHLDEPACPRFRFVQGVAKGAGMDFFAPGLASQRPPHLGNAGSNLFPVLAEAFNRIDPVQHWGINE